MMLKMSSSQTYPNEISSEIDMVKSICDVDIGTKKYLVLDVEYKESILVW